MKVIFLSLVIAIIVYNSNGQKNNKYCKSNNNADSCMQRLLLLGDPKFKFPTNKAEMNTHCRTITKEEKCIKTYSSKCLDTFPRQVTNVLAYGVAKTNKGYCTNQRRKNSFIAFGKCANKLKLEGDKCMNTFIDQLLGIENYEDSKMKIPLACCNYYKLKECILNKVRAEGPPLCNESDVTEMERIIDGYALEVLNLICGDYVEESDKCEKIIGRTPKKLESQKKPKSILPPFINILSST